MFSVADTDFELRGREGGEVLNYLPCWLLSLLLFLPCLTKIRGAFLRSSTGFVLLISQQERTCMFSKKTVLFGYLFTCNVAQSKKWTNMLGSTCPVTWYVHNEVLASLFPRKVFMIVFSVED